MKQYPREVSEANRFSRSVSKGMPREEENMTTGSTEERLVN